MKTKITSAGGITRGSIVGWTRRAINSARLFECRGLVRRVTQCLWAGETAEITEKPGFSVSVLPCRELRLTASDGEPLTLDNPPAKAGMWEGCRHES